MKDHVDAADVNRDVFNSPEVVAGFVASKESLSELRVLRHIATEVRGHPVLDLGIGTGRTTWLLRLLTDQYVGVDIAPNMVDEARRQFLTEDLRVGDARDLNVFADATFTLVVFSNNGIDAVGHADRGRVLSEMTRVTAPGGYVVYSTHNRQGSSFGERPWQLHRPFEEPNRSLRRAAVFLLRLPTKLGGYADSYRNWWRNRQRQEVHDEWAVAPLRAHGFRPLVHFVSIRQLQDELAVAGLDLVGLWSQDGEEIDPDEGRSRAHYFHVLARRPAVVGVVLGPDVKLD